MPVLFTKASISTQLEKFNLAWIYEIKVALQAHIFHIFLLSLLSS